jgi:hypothetical protein
MWLATPSELRTRQLMTLHFAEGQKCHQVSLVERDVGITSSPKPKALPLLGITCREGPEVKYTGASVAQGCGAYPYMDGIRSNSATLSALDQHNNVPGRLLVQRV